MGRVKDYYHDLINSKEWQDSQPQEGPDTMPASYLTRHRPICAVIQEIKQIAADAEGCEFPVDQLDKIETLCDEARTYAESMSKKLQEYKDKENKT